MIAEILKKVDVARSRIAGKFSKAFHFGDVMTHLFYGVALFTETHEGMVGIAALGVGIAVVLVTFFGSHD